MKERCATITQPTQLPAADVSHAPTHRPLRGQVPVFCFAMFNVYRGVTLDLVEVKNRVPVMVLVGFTSSSIRTDRPC